MNRIPAAMVLTLIIQIANPALVTNLKVALSLTSPLSDLYDKSPHDCKPWPRISSLSPTTVYMPRTDKAIFGKGRNHTSGLLSDPWEASIHFLDLLDI